MKRLIELNRWLAGLLLLAALLTTAQARGESRYRISIVTMYPGEDLFTGFGHVALRVRDRLTGADRSFDYGTYDGNDPFLAWNFLIGRLKYFCTGLDFHEMVEWYSADFGGIIEQELALPTKAAGELVAIVSHDVAPENASYPYHHFHNNCATKLRDALDQVLDGALSRQTSAAGAGRSFRNLIDASLSRPAHAPIRWLVFGLLNGRIDVEVSRWEQMFLPHYLAEELRDLEIDGHPLVASEKILVEGPRQPPTLPAQTPGLIATFLLLLLFAAPGLLSLAGRPESGRRLLSILFVLAGLAALFYGTILIVGWLASPYPETRNNWTLLLFHPGHLVLCVGGVWLWLRAEARLLSLYLLVGVPVSLLAMAVDGLSIIDQEIWPYAVGTLAVSLGSLLSLYWLRCDGLLRRGTP